MCLWIVDTNDEIYRKFVRILDGRSFNGRCPEYKWLRTRVGQHTAVRTPTISGLRYVSFSCWRDREHLSLMCLPKKMENKTESFHIVYPNTCKGRPPQLSSYNAFRDYIHCQHHVIWLSSSLQNLPLVDVSSELFFNSRGPLLKRTLIGIKRCKAYLVLSFVIGIATMWPFLVLYGKYTEVHHGILTKTCLINDEYVSNKKAIAIQPFWHGIYLISSILVVDTVLILIFSLIGCSIHHADVGSPSFKRVGPISSASVKQNSSINACYSF